MYFRFFQIIQKNRFGAQFLETEIYRSTFRASAVQGSGWNGNALPGG